MIALKSYTEHINSSKNYIAFKKRQTNTNFCSDI